MSSAHTAPQAEAAPDPRRWVAMAILLLSSFMNLIDVTIVYPAGRTERTELRVREDGTFGGGDNDDRRRARRVVITDDGDGVEAWADLTIGIPEGRDVAVHQAVGTVVVRNVNGTLLVDTHSAEVEASGTRGALTVDVGSGNVSPWASPIVFFRISTSTS